MSDGNTLLEQALESAYAVPVSIGGALLLTWRYLSRLVSEDNRRGAERDAKIAAQDVKIEGMYGHAIKQAEELGRCDEHRKIMSDEMKMLRERMRELEKTQ